MYKLSGLQYILAIIFLIVETYYSYSSDDIRFCVDRSERSTKEPPNFHYNQLMKKHVNTGGKACLEDIVEYVNFIRAGDDRTLNTKDDNLNIDEQIILISDLLKDEFQGYWVSSPWHICHSFGISAQMKLLYTDVNEYILVFGNRFSHGGYSGSFYFDVWDFPLEGNHYTQEVGNMTPQLHRGDATFSLLKNSEIKDEISKFTAFLPRGHQRIYSSEGPKGSILLEYGRGNIASALFTSLIFPYIFRSYDFRSLWISLLYFAKGTLANSSYKTLTSFIIMKAIKFSIILSCIVIISLIMKNILRSLSKKMAPF